MLKITLIAAAAFGSASAVVSADVVDFTIDSSLSSITVTGLFAGDTGMAQFPGSDSTALSGTLVADVDASSISFPGGSSIDALPQTSPVAPGPTALPLTTGLGDFGLDFNVFLLGIVPVAGYDFEFDLNAASQALDGSGNFDSSGSTVSVLGGELAYDAGLASGVESLVGESALNLASAGMLTTVGNVQTLTIPVDLSLLFTGLLPDDSQVDVTGQIVATRVVPEPATATVLAMTGGLLLGRRRR